MDALPPLAIRAKLEAATASAFSLTIRRYSAGEQSLWAISNVRRMTVSHDASIRLVIITGTETLFRRPRLAMAGFLRRLLQGLNAPQLSMFQSCGHLARSACCALVPS